MSAKGEARKNIISNYTNLLANRDPKTQIGIRLNSISSGNLFEDDLQIFANLDVPPEAILLPKVESPQEAQYFLQGTGHIVHNTTKNFL